jgi:hypothetical protein
LVPVPAGVDGWNIRSDIVITTAPRGAGLPVKSSAVAVTFKGGGADAAALGVEAGEVVDVDWGVPPHAVTTIARAGSTNLVRFIIVSLLSSAHIMVAAWVADDVATADPLGDREATDHPGILVEAHRAVKLEDSRAHPIKREHRLVAGPHVSRLAEGGSTRAKDQKRMDVADIRPIHAVVLLRVPVVDVDDDLGRSP